MKRECYNKNVTNADSSQNKKKHYFVKTRTSCCPNPHRDRPNGHRFEFESHPSATSRQHSTEQSFPNFRNQCNTTISCNHKTNPIMQNISNDDIFSLNLHPTNRSMNPISSHNYHSVEASNYPKYKLFNVIYDRYEKLREIETFRAENANECISVLNQQTNHNRVPNKSTVKHVCLHRYRYLMEPTMSNGRGESKCELCEKWFCLERLKDTVAGGNCCIVDKIDSSDFVNGDDGTNDCKIILEVQSSDISSKANPRANQIKKKNTNRSWTLVEQAKSLALNQQQRV